MRGFEGRAKEGDVSRAFAAVVLAVVGASLTAQSQRDEPVSPGWCKQLPRPEYRTLARVTSAASCVVIAASMATWVAEKRQSVGLHVNGSDPLKPGSPPQTIPPRKGQGHLMRMLDILARIDELNAAGASLESFNVTQGYVDWCLVQQHQLWGAVARQGQTLRETSDMIFDGWQSRSQTSDIIAEKGSDAFRGVERVYDPKQGVGDGVMPGDSDGVGVGVGVDPATVTSRLSAMKIGP